MGDSFKACKRAYSVEESLKRGLQWAQSVKLVCFVYDALMLILQLSSQYEVVMVNTLKGNYQ